MENKLTPKQEKLVLDNQRLVHYLFKGFRAQEFKISHWQDFISEGMIGLIKAAKTFDPNKGAKFATYSSLCITNQFKMYLRHLRKKEGPTIPLSTPVGGDSETLTLADTEIMIDETTPRAIEEYMDNEERTYFLKSIKPRHREVIELRMQDKSQREIANSLGYSQSYVSRICKNVKQQFKIRRERENAI